MEKIRQKILEDLTTAYAGYQWNLLHPMQCKTVEEMWHHYHCDGEFNRKVKGFVAGTMHVLEPILSELEKSISELKHKEKEINFYSKCFERIANAHGIDSPLIRKAKEKDDKEAYAAILARHVEETMKGKDGSGS